MDHNYMYISHSRRYYCRVTPIKHSTALWFDIWSCDFKVTVFWLDTTYTHWPVVQLDQATSDTRCLDTSVIAGLPDTGNASKTTSQSQTGLV